VAEAIFDYIVVGAGSAGCALANRLSADARNSVLLLEAGPRDSNPFLRIPAGIAKVYVHPKLNWGYSTEPSPQLNGRRIYWPRGKTLGGSSSINGMIYIRGQAQDYDAWEKAGNPGWGWRDVLATFKRLERHEEGASDWAGGEGELDITRPRFRHPSGDAFLSACEAAGYPLTQDFNGADQEGADYYRFTIRNGMRASSASAFLNPARGRANLHVLTGAHAEQLVIEGSRATGVVVNRGQQSIVYRARREIVLAAGALNSPQLLMLSGIGPAARLGELGIPVVRDISGVGQNLHDHLLVQHIAQVSPIDSINRQMSGPRLAPSILRYLLNRKGLLTIGASQVAAFLKSDASLDRPDMQIMFKPYTIEMSPAEKIVPGSKPAWTTAASPLRPKSRGWLTLKTADWRDPPIMQPNFLEHEDDRASMVAGLKMIRRIFSAPPLDGQAREVVPGDAVQSDAELLEFVRANAGSVFHPVGTCRMGDDTGAVVDSRLRVRGIDGLRVADASIMPSIVSGNTNAASIMIGAKAGEMIVTEGRPVPA
jgi:choline dehydrogenase